MLQLYTWSMVADCTSLTACSASEIHHPQEVGALTAGPDSVSHKFVMILLSHPA